MSIEAIRLIARSLQRSLETRPRGGRVENPRHAFRLTIATGQQVWLGCEALELWQLPSGAVFINAPLAAKGLPSIKITPGLTTGTASLSGGVYRFLDPDRELADWLAGKQANGLQLFSRTIEQFDLGPRDDLGNPVTLQRSLRYTLRIQDLIRADNKVYEIKAVDVQRELETDIFNKPPFRLYSPIAENSTIIPITLPPAEMAEHDYRFEHATEYLVAPGKTLGIVLIDEEYIGYESLTSGELAVNGDPVVTLGNPIRGMFGTLPTRHEVGADTPPENRPEMEHVAYAEESWASMAHMLIAGETLDGRPFPFSAKVNPQWVDDGSFADADAEDRRTLRRHEKVSAKTFIEEQILSRMPAIMVPDPRGRLSLRQVNFFRAPSSEDVLDESTCYGSDLGSLDIDASDCAFPFNLLWDQEPVSETWRQNTQWIDEPAAIESGVFDPPKPITYEAELLTTGRNTEAAIRRIAAVLHSKHALPVKRLTAKPTRELWHLLPGDAVTVRHYPTDYIGYGSLAQAIDTTMLIASVTDNQNQQDVSWDLVGFAAPNPAFTQASEPLPTEAFTTGGTPLPGVSGGVATNVTLELGRKYYVLGSVTYPANWSPTFTGNGDLTIWHKGTWIWAAQISLVGKGGKVGLQGNIGQQGFHAASGACGAWTARARRFVNSSNDPQGVTSINVVSHPPRAPARSLRGDIPETMSVENGRVVGMPRTLQGSGGNHGETSDWSDYTEIEEVSSGTTPGSSGGRGGGGVFLLGAGGSGFVDGGFINISGEDGAAPQQGYLQGYGAAGGGGAHGHAVFVTDGPGTLVNVSGSRLIAQNGSVALRGTRVPNAESLLRGSAAISPWRGWHQPPNTTTNNWQNAHSIGYVPESQIAVDTNYLSVFDEFFANQRDSAVVIIVSATQPSDANLADMWITPTALTSNSATPTASLLHTDGWQPYGWDDRYIAVYSALVAMRREYPESTQIVSRTTRPVIASGSIGWHNPDNDTITVIHADGRPDDMIFAGETQLGDNRWSDPRFARWRQGEPTWHVGTDITALPVFTDLTQPVVDPDDDYELPAPTLSVLVYSGNQAEAIIGFPADPTGVTGYELRRGGSLIASLGANEGSYLDNGVLPNTPYRYEARSVGAGGTRSADTAFDIMTPDDGSTPNTAPTITYGAVRGFWAPFGETSGGATDLQVTDATGPVIQGVATGAAFVGRSVFISNTANSVGVDSSNVSSGGLWSATISASVASQQLTAYVESADSATSESVVFNYVQGSTNTGNTLQPVSNAVGAVYSSTAIELTWDVATDITSESRVQVYRNDVLVRTTPDQNVNSHYVDNLSPDTLYTWRLRHVRGAERSDDVTITTRTNA